MKRGLLFIIAAYIMLALPIHVNAAEFQVEPTEINSLVTELMEKGKIPGASVVIVQNDEVVHSKSYGDSNQDAKYPVTPKTYFELGSNSKAFTALGILKLEKEGKINLLDPVTMYIPWFKMKYRGSYNGSAVDGYVDITLRQLLYHTSGIPFNSIGDIPVADDANALEFTVRTQVDKYLDKLPGEQFEYATINYDILGLVIEYVTGEGFADYMSSNVLEPLGLNNTYTDRRSIPMDEIATGYKVRFLSPHAYEAPIYKGNVPAGYFITNMEDLTKWIEIQLGAESVSPEFRALLEASHIPDRTVKPDYDGSSYAAGWSAFQDGGGMIAHGGSNPNYSSYIILRPEEKLGIGVLTNLNSSYTEAIAFGLDHILHGEAYVATNTDQYQSIDIMSFTIVLICIPLSMATICLLGFALVQIVQKKRRFTGGVGKTIRLLLSLFLFMMILGYCLYRVPDVFYFGLPWTFVKVWAPNSFLVAIHLLLATVIIFCLYFALTSIYTKKNDKSLFSIAVLSIVSGFGNAIVVFLVNEVLNRNNGFQPSFLLFFIVAIMIYIFGQRKVRTRLLAITNELVYTKRIQLIDRILNAPYEKFEQMKDGKLHAGLNNDTEAISDFTTVAITTVTSVVTLACCFVYLGIVNWYGLLISLFVIFIAAGLYFIVGRATNKIWEETRDIQNVFLKFINGLISGFKELKLNAGRRTEFISDMRNSCYIYKTKRIKGDLGFANVFIIGELLFTLVIGVVAFVFPSIFPDIQTESLRSYILVFLYMTGPVNGVLNSIPQLIRMKISYNRLIALGEELKHNDVIEELTDSMESADGKYQLDVKDIVYEYKSDTGEVFSIGPISCSFQAGQVTFITGGNGSGKSTLAKIVTGLYKPDKGQIQYNGCTVRGQQIAQLYSAVFSEYYVFDKLYGISVAGREEEIDQLLKKMGLYEKMIITDNSFSTTKLSSGQRKRLALLVSYLEDRPFYLFDEWAADQDPEFRAYFYNSLLPELKKNGKCIIAVTHDDRYFNTADQIIKMDIGQIVEQKSTLFSD